MLIPHANNIWAATPIANLFATITRPVTPTLYHGHRKAGVRTFKAQPDTRWLSLCRIAKPQSCRQIGSSNTFVCMIFEFGKDIKKAPSSGDEKLSIRDLNSVDKLVSDVTAPSDCLHRVRREPYRFSPCAISSIR
jgi:hypothetical protein